MNKVIFLMVLLLVPTTISSANEAQRQDNRLIVGNCKPWDCQTLLQDLSKHYPDYIQAYQKSCPMPAKMSMQVLGQDVSESGVAFFSCWEANKDQQGNREGSSLGKLPLPGQEAGFLAVLPDGPHTQQLQQRYPQEIKAAQFRCATQSGNILWEENGIDQTVQLKCWHSIGVASFDENDDFQSDGEYTHGTVFDESLGTFVVGR